MSGAKSLSLDDLIIRPSDSLEDGLRVMTENRKGILFVCNDQHHLVGVLTDGDVRRCLLEKTLLLAPVSKAMNTDPIVAQSVDAGLSIIKKQGLIALPIVDHQGMIHHVIISNNNEIQVISALDDTSQPKSVPISPSEVLAIIPARGGSKRIPQKNLSQVAGKSLVEWAIQSAQKTEEIGNILVSTDDKSISEVASDSGVPVPWLRPDELAQDSSSSISVVIHEVKRWVEEKGPLKLVLLLEPTTPLRRPETLSTAIEMLSTSDADAVVSVCELPHQFHPEETLRIQDGVVEPYLSNRTMKTRRLRGSQDPTYIISGVVYAVKVDALLAYGSLFGHKTIALETPWEEFLDIDHPIDLERAELVMKDYISEI